MNRTMSITHLHEPTFEDALGVCLDTLMHLLDADPTAEGWYALKAVTKVACTLCQEEHGRHQIPPTSPPLQSV